MRNSGVRDICPDALYAFSGAARLIPSCRDGKTLHVSTLHRLRQEGRIQAVCRERGRRKFWFIWGAELLRFLQADTAPTWNGRTPAERRRAIEAAEAEAVRLGVVSPGPRPGKEGR